MNKSITEGMKRRKQIIEYAIKEKNNAKAARKYHVTRQYVHYWMKRYDGTIESLRKESTKPKSHPKEHTVEEQEKIKHCYRYHRHEGLAQVYRKLQEKGYTRCYDSMTRQIKKLKLKTIQEKKENRKQKKEKKVIKATRPGEQVQVDIKYVPLECIGFKSEVDRYYQITGIDVYTRKRILKIVKEKSTYETSNYLNILEKEMGFKIKQIQTDNGLEFTNDQDRTNRKSRFQKRLEELGIEHKLTAPYSPWQNGYVERSHREDSEKFYANRRFKSEEEMYKSFERYAKRQNNIAKKVLKFKTANEMLEDYIEKEKVRV